MSWIDLPLPPTGNQLFINLKRGGRTLKPVYRQWRDNAAALIAVQAAGSRVSGPYALHISAGRPDRRKRDIDNIIKPISDALVKGGLVDDDSDCQCVKAEWIAGMAGVRVMVIPTKRIEP